MVFLDRPAESLDELFDREREVAQLASAVKDRAAVLVVGFRRAGKTSLVKAATGGGPRVYIDVRAFEDRGYVTYDDFLTLLSKSLAPLLPRYKRLGELLKGVRGVNVAGVGVEFERGREAPRFVELLEALDRLGEERGERVVLILDEAQELAKMRGRTLLPVLAYAYDNLRHLSIVYTGSKVGLLARFLRLSDPESPLFGRYLERIEVAPFSRDLSLRYLEEGFAAAGVKVENKILEEAVDVFDGIVGWLAHFGLRALRSPQTAVQETLSYAVQVAESEFCRFVEYMGSQRYVYVVKLAAHGARWSEVKRYLAAVEGRRITDAEVTKLLKNLVDYGFLEKRGDLYAVADPVLRRAAAELKCRTTRAPWTSALTPPC
ncbi:MAG: ATP-binding protein [Pyrobaculum sp.]